MLLPEAKLSFNASWGDPYDFIHKFYEGWSKIFEPGYLCVCISDKKNLQALATGSY